MKKLLIIGVAVAAAAYTPVALAAVSYNYENVTVTVRTLMVGGVQKPDGNYTFGSGTLRVFKPGMVVKIY